MTTIVSVAIVAVAIGYFLKRSEDPVAFVIDGIKVVIGLGLVILIHELGHFVAAKWCDVHVETFSIGFGGPLLGICKYRWGETTYKIAWVPLGGYVKMLGEGDDNEETAEDPRAYKNKKVWQRMIIISAGVVMNLVLAFVAFVFVLETRGIELTPGIVGTVEPGGPAWKKGLRPGDVIDRIGGTTSPHFKQLQREVIRNGRDSSLTFDYDRYVDGKPVHVDTTITPMRSGDVLAPMLLLRAPSTTVFIGKTASLKNPCDPMSAAGRASPPFQFGDRIVACTDPENPDRVTPLKIDPRYPNTNQTDYFEFSRRLQLLIAQPIVVRVERTDGSTADIRVEPEYARPLGVRFRMGPISAIRDDSPSAKAGVQVKQGNVDGDVIESVEVTDADGKPLKFSAAPHDAEQPLDPIRLPTQLALWAISKPKDYTVKVAVQRTEGHSRETKVLTMQWDKDWDLFDTLPLVPDFPMSIAPLGIAYFVQNTMAGTDPDSPASKTSLKDGDQVTAIEYKVESASGKTDSQKYDVKENQGACYFSRISASERFKEVTLTLRSGATVSLTPVEDRSWPLVDRGFGLKEARFLLRATDLGNAAVLAADQEMVAVGTIYENLSGLVRGRLSVRAIAGPITIVNTAFLIAGRNIYEFILFIAMISVNLAVVNFLPIPVLDGGHMMFLTYELLRGKPPSERWRFWLTIIGLVVVLSLMVLGLALDAQRQDILGWLKSVLGL
jgi:regulator of sigma E protease